VITRTRHTCRAGVVQADTWHGGCPLSIRHGRLHASGFLIVAVDAGRPTLARLSTGLDRLGWRLRHWRSSATADHLELTVAVEHETLSTVRQELVELTGGKGDIVAVPAIGHAC
jgi:hypothetical protein